MFISKRFQSAESASHVETLGAEAVAVPLGCAITGVETVSIVDPIIDTRASL